MSLFNEPNTPPGKLQNSILSDLYRQHQLIFISVILITLLLIIAPTAIYVISFWSNPISSDPKVFSDFGGYFGGVTGVIVSVINVVLLGYIAIHLEQIRIDLDQRKSKHEAKLRLLMFLSEWSSAEMWKNRGKADDIVRKYPEDNYLQIHDKQEIEDSESLSMIVSFFQFLNASIDSEIISEQEAIRAFGQIFCLVGYSCGERISLGLGGL